MDAALKRKIGQMFIAGFPSPEVDDQARALVNDFCVGNFALFGRNIVDTEQIVHMIGGLHALAYEKNGVAALIGTDQEGGVVSRITTGAALFPGTMAAAASPGADTYRMGENCGRILSTLGIRCSFSPVLDVNMDPMNPIIGSRAYCDDPDTVARLGVAMLRGMQDAGAAAAVKHFPGHGNVAGDSHLMLPRNTTPRTVLEETEWMTFRKAFEAGADALMTCHVVFEDVDPDYPATLSPAIMTGLLRDQLGFTGVAITDCMEMDAVRKCYGIGRGAVLAVQAGCDLLCFSHTYEAVAEAANALYDAVERGEISADRIELSYRRILALKEKYGLLTPPAADITQARRRMTDADAIAYSTEVSRRSMTLMRDAGGLDMLKKAAHPRFFAPASIAVTGAEDKDRAPTRFAELAAQRFGGDGVTVPMNEPDEATLAAIRDDSWDVGVLGLYNARLRPGQQELLRLLEADGRPLVVALLGAPYDLPLVQRADSVLCAYEYTWLAANALLDAMERGEFPGIVPVKL